ncbi:MAG: trypsin-like peptidase domain-containing protein [bacterium]|nr:trypsin-like peptidase domain-containing protein [bacterium]
MKLQSIIISFVLVAILTTPALTFAATDPGLKPGNFFYIFDTTSEKIVLFFTFNPENKVKKALEYADERLAEIEVVAETNPDAIKGALANYESKVILAAEKSKEIKDEKKAEELLTLITDNAPKQQEILSAVLAKVPEEAKEAIVLAIEVSKRGQEKAQEQISELNKEITELKQEIAELKHSQSENKQSLQKAVAAINKTSKKLTNKEIITNLKPATVYIETKNGSGSGMILSVDGTILTNAHVVARVSAAVIKLSDGRTFSASVTGRDENIDLAVLKINNGDSNFKFAELGDSDAIEQGDEVFAFGFPFGIEGDVSFKEGTISRRLIDGSGVYFETSAELHPGNSGGPLVNRYGQVVGINTAIYSSKQIEGVILGETIKLAIPINIAKNLISDLMAGRNIEVESQKEKQVKQETVKRSTCLAESEQYYNNLVRGINQSDANDSDVQRVLSQIDQQIESIRRSLNDDTSRISSQYDSLISQLRDSAERYAQSVQTSLIRSGSARYAQDSSSGMVEVARHSNDSQIAIYESQKQLQISSAQSNANIYIARYEALKAKARSDKESDKQSALTNAKNKKTEYYNKCVSQ